MIDAVLVASGAVAGALLRWRLTAGRKPAWPTVAAINVSGSFALGMAYGLDAKARTLLFAGTGFLGSLTTFSTFSVDTVALIQQGLIVRAFGLALGTPALGIGGAALGLLAGRSIVHFQRRRRPTI